jgi:TM2 domain-containing membrane protein YozV
LAVSDSYVRIRLNFEQKAMLKREFKRRRRSGFSAFVLWLFLGLFGVHLFYLGRVAVGALKAAIFAFIVYGFYSALNGGLMSLTAFGCLAWTLADVFFLRKMLIECNEKIEKALIKEIAEMGAPQPPAPEAARDPSADEGGAKRPGTPEADEFIGAARGGLQRLAGFYDETGDKNLKREIREVCSAIERVVNYISENPGYVQRARKLSKIYIPEAIALLKEYIPIEREDMMSDETAESRRRVETGLDAIEHYAEEILGSLHQIKHNEIRDRSEVLDRSLRMEGSNHRADSTENG